MPASPGQDAVALRGCGQNEEVQAAAVLGKLRHNLESVLLGKSDALQLALVALLAEGHVLIEDVPGVGKTLLAKALARSLACSFHRLQFTPDLLPSDLIGTSVYNQASGQFVFHPGPLFAQVVLADEINRATPRTQSALLEAMSDRQVSVDGQSHPLGPPFVVLATQNPYEFEGTYPLPESQLDRFLMRIRLGYPPRAAEKEALTLHRQGEPVDQLAAVCAAAEILAMQNLVRQVAVADSLNDYILDLIQETRSSAQVYVGGSTRAALALYRAAQALAFLEQRNFVVPDDVKRLTIPVLAHRLLMKSVRQAGPKDAAESLLREILDRTPIPG